MKEKIKKYFNVLVSFVLGVSAVSVAPTLGVGEPPILQRDNVQFYVPVASSTVGLNDVIFYPIDVGLDLTTEEINADIEQRITERVEFIREQSRATTTRDRDE